MKKRLIVLLLGPFILGACNYLPSGTPPYENDNQYVRTEAEFTRDIDQAAPMSEAVDPTNTNQNSLDRSIIYEAWISLESLDYSKAKEAISETVQSLDGIIEHQVESNDTYTNSAAEAKTLRRLSMRIRVPQADFQSLLQEIEELESVSVTESGQGAEDVTHQVTDLDLRIASVEARIDRLNELNKAAESVTEMIEIETALQMAILERDQLLSQEASLNDQIAMATLELSLREVQFLSGDSSGQQTFGDRIIKALEETFWRTGEAIQESLLTLVYLLPYIVVLILFFLLIRWLVIPFFRLFRRKKRPTDKEQAQKVTEYRVKETQEITVPSPEEETITKSNEK